MVRTEVRVAAIDIGTNTVRLLIADGSPSGLVDVEREVDVVGLGVGVDHTGIISVDAIGRAIPVLEGYGARIRALEVERSRIVATSATRDAANRDEIMALVAEATGIVPEVISGDEEASLAFTGATHGLAADPPALVIDPGGGSTEFILGGAAPEYLISIDIGSVRLTDRLLPDRPTTPRAVEAARAHVAGVCAAVVLPRAPATVIGVAGTFTSLAAMALELTQYDRDRVHGSVLTRSEVDAMVDHLTGLTMAQTAAIPSLDPKRAPVVLAGAIVVSEALFAVGAAEAIVSESDSLDAVAMSLSRG